MSTGRYDLGSIHSRALRRLGYRVERRSATAFVVETHHGGMLLVLRPERPELVHLGRASGRPDGVGDAAALDAASWVNRTTYAARVVVGRNLLVCAEALVALQHCLPRTGDLVSLLPQLADAVVAAESALGEALRFAALTADLIEGEVQR